jgi:hypothetical protein
MKKRYIFLIVSLVLVISITYLLKDDYQSTFIEKTQEEIKDMHQRQDSIFIFADDVLNEAFDRKKEDETKISILDEMVKKKQIKIEDQVTQLKKLVNESNEMKKLAEEERNKAMEMEKMANLQKMEAEKVKEKLMFSLEELQKENGLLKKNETGHLKTIKELEEKVSFLRKKIDFLTSKDSENKKKKRGTKSGF